MLDREIGVKEMILGLSGMVAGAVIFVGIMEVLFDISERIKNIDAEHAPFYIGIDLFFLVVGIFSFMGTGLFFRSHNDEKHNN